MPDAVAASVSRDWQPANHGIVCWGTVPPDAVVCVTGIPRTGTTSAAEILCSLWPDRFLFDGRDNLEHYALVAALKAGDIETARATLAERCAWKSPAMWMFEPALRAAVGDRIAWVVTTRDVAATALREAEYRKEDPGDWLQRQWRWSIEMGRWFAGLTDPRAIVSAEKMLTDRVSIRLHLAAWLKGALP